MIQALVPVIRAAVQAGVAAVLAFLIVHGVPVPPEAAGALVLALTGILTGVLAKGQQWLERKYPWLGVLLGTPIYSPGLNRLRAVNSDLEKAQGTVTDLPEGEDDEDDIEGEPPLT